MDIPSLFMIPSAVSSGKVHSVFPNSTDADFDFNRDSDATRVNSEGLIERVGFYGAEKLSNNDFTNGLVGYSGTTNYSVVNNQLVANSSGLIYQGSILTNSTFYKFTIDIESVTSGGIKAYANGNQSAVITTAGIHTLIIQAGTSNTLAGLNPQGTFIGVINSISFKEVLGNRARLNYEIEGGLVNTKPSLLLEPQSTNLIKYSNDYTQSEWNKISGATVDANVAISPDGTLNASRLNFNTVVGSRMEDQIASASSGDYSFAVYLKADEPKTVGIRTGFAGTATVNVNVTTEWQRFSITQNNPTNPANGYAQIRSIDASGGSVYVWGAQIEQLSYSTSFIPTNGSTQTRAAETCNGAGTSSILPSSDGIFYAEIAALANDGTSRVISLSDGSNTNRIHLLYFSQNNFISANYRVSGSTQAFVNVNLSNALLFHKIAWHFRSGKFKLFIDGSLAGSNSNTTMLGVGVINELAFNEAPSSTPFYGKIRDIRVYNTKEMTDSEVDILLTKITS